MAEQIKKQAPTICCFQETHLSSKDKHRLKVKGWKMILQADGSQKKTDVVILISDKIDFKPKGATRDKHGHCIMIKGTIHQEDITMIIYAPKIRVLKYIKQSLPDTKGEIDSNTVTVGNFNTPLTSVDKSPRQKVNQETMTLNETLNRWI